jgi:hypothetical protein
VVIVPSRSVKRIIKQVLSAVPKGESPLGTIFLDGVRLQHRLWHFFLTIGRDLGYAMKVLGVLEKKDNDILDIRESVSNSRQGILRKSIPTACSKSKHKLRKNILSSEYPIYFFWKILGVPISYHSGILRFTEYPPPLFVKDFFR